MSPVGVYTASWCFSYCLGALGSSADQRCTHEGHQNTTVCGVRFSISATVRLQTGTQERSAWAVVRRVFTHKSCARRRDILEHLLCIPTVDHRVVQADVLALVLVDAGVAEAGVLVALELPRPPNLRRPNGISTGLSRLLSGCLRNMTVFRSSRDCR